MLLSARTAVVATTIVLLLAFEAKAQTGNFTFSPSENYNQARKTKNIQPNYQHRYEDKVYAFTFYSTSSSGGTTKGAIYTLFSNGKKVDGNTLCSEHKWLDASGTAVVASHIRAGINPAGFSGGAKERAVLRDFVLPTEKLRSVRSWSSRYYRCGKVPDQLFCIGIVKGATYVMGLPSELSAVCKL